MAKTLSRERNITLYHYLLELQLRHTKSAEEFSMRFPNTDSKLLEPHRIEAFCVKDLHWMLLYSVFVCFSYNNNDLELNYYAYNYI